MPFLPLLQRLFAPRAAAWPPELALAGIGLARWDLGRAQASASPQWLSLAGPLPAQGGPAGWLGQQAHPLDRARLQPRLEALCRNAALDELREPLRLRPPGQGDWRWFELRLRAEARRRDGRAQRLFATLSDISAQRVAEERQRMSVALFQQVHEGLVVTDLNHQVLDASPSYCQLMGRPREALQGRVAAPLSEAMLRRSGHDPARLRQAVQAGETWQGLVQGERDDGRPCSLQLSLAAIPEPDGPPRYLVLTVSDLTEQMQQRARLDQQQAFDPLTGLPNQAEFRLRLEQALQSSQREGFTLCIACLDLDHFQRVNERHGRALGDRLLGLVAERLRGALRSGREWSDDLARLGGDEFGLLLRCRDAAEAQRALERLLNVLRAPYHLEGLAEPLDIGASLGATLYPRDQSDGETLQRHAAHALYRVKRSGRNGHQLFDTEKRARNEAQAMALGRMQEALDAGELRLFYQPKVDMRRGRVLGAEALLRWQHPERGLLAPAHFLPVLERTGLAAGVGDWVIEQALQQSSRWLAQGLALRVSVNVTARHLQTHDFAQRLQELLARHPAAPLAEHLMLEVLESAALADIEATQALIRRCRLLGVSFALDDFGTGYSTLTYLKRLPVDTLKIDRSFVQNMLIDDQDRALVEGVIGLARHFGCSVVAEGVETASHARALMALGCDQGQGNGIALPMAADELADWVARFEARPVLAGRQDAAEVSAIH
ncbi:EAL domain-containing protein [Roseateles sp. DAIF2]|uniref:putative bifunctional diguanylate cyclase/phosphodiesterase n=1 Tax=Roseateles sp. DAIF2 TaxID=2714952 RepID=UPI0018A32467|nr:GGDEF and EAL domain-containing protein [Roseateles sp. DAIF2]QPF74842.1 EAL domain-containing protein [Roseateles sp. DAIF2]